MPASRKKAVSKTMLAAGVFFLLAPAFIGSSRLPIAAAETVKEGEKTYQAGERIYLASCSSCHPWGSNVMRPDKPIMNSPMLKDLDTFSIWLRHPKAPMTSFSPAELTNGEVRDLYQYITKVLHQTGTEKGR